MIAFIGLDKLREAQEELERQEDELQLQLMMLELGKPPKIVSAMRIEIQDRRTCGYCNAIHGMVLDINDPRVEEYVNRNIHPGCRGTFYYMTELMPSEYTFPNFIEPSADLLPRSIIVKAPAITGEEIPEEIMDDYAKKPVLRKQEFVPARTTAEGEEFAKEILGMKDVDYEGFPLEFVNSINKTVFEAQQRFPILKGRMTYLGSSKTEIKLVYAERVKANTAFLKKNYPDMTDEDIRNYVKETTLMPEDMKKGNWARMRGGDDIKIGYNLDELKDAERLKAKMDMLVDSGFHVKGTGSLEGLTWHEIGHALEDIAKTTKSGFMDELQNLWMDILNEATRISNNTNISFEKALISKTCGYTAQQKGRVELISELTTEAMLSDEPREYALKLEALLDKYFGEGKK